MRSFHRDRVDLVLRGETTFPLIETGAKAFVHVIPISHFASGEYLPLNNVPGLDPSGGAGVGAKLTVPNFDGRIAHDDCRPAGSHIQVFRDGAVEVANMRILKKVSGQQQLEAFRVEGAVLSAVRQAHRFFRGEPTIEGPYVVMLTLVGVQGVNIPSQSPSDHSIDVHQIERDRLEFPEVQIDDPACEDLPQVLRPVFDMLWQAGGWEKSLNFKGDGSYGIMGWDA